MIYGMARKSSRKNRKQRRLEGFITFSWKTSSAAPVLNNVTAFLSSYYETVTKRGTRGTDKVSYVFSLPKICLKIQGQGMVAHTSNPRTLGGRGRWIA